MAEAALHRYRGRDFTRADIGFIAELIEAHPQACRQELSRLLCQAWGWRQANGHLRDMVCRGLLLKLHRAGEIVLPPARSRSPGRAARTRPEPVLLDTAPIEVALGELGAVDLAQVRRTGDEGLFNSLVEQYHYLGYEQPVGEHLKYLAWAQGRPVAALALSSAPRHIAARDRFIGWDQVARRRNIHLVAYNTRFLVLPWVRIRSTCWKPLSIGNGSAEPVIWRPTGSEWARPLDAARTTRPKSRTARSRMCWCCRSTGGSGTC